jgi:hypothetical protein
MSEFDHSQVRLRFLRDAANTCIIPCVILAVALKITQVRLGYLTIPTLIAFIFLFAYIRALAHDYGQARLAGKLGARPIPCVVGKWPGNIDLIPRLLADLKSGYMQDVFLELFHEYQSTTLNLKILWSDKASVLYIILFTMDDHLPLRLLLWIKNTSSTYSLRDLMDFGPEIQQRKYCLWAFHGSYT